MKKNIAIFSHTIALGGSERVACLIAELLASNKLYNIYIVIQKKSKYSYQIDNTNINLVVVNNIDNKNKKIEKILIEKKIDVCIFNDHFISETFSFILIAKKIEYKNYSY